PPSGNGRRRAGCRGPGWPAKLEGPPGRPPTGRQECPPGQTGLPVSATRRETRPLRPGLAFRKAGRSARTIEEIDAAPCFNSRSPPALKHGRQIGRASCRERGESAGGDGIRKRKE